MVHRRMALAAALIFIAWLIPGAPRGVFGHALAASAKHNAQTTKCKKGYKLVKGKCKKKSTGPVSIPTPVPTATPEVLTGTVDLSGTMDSNVTITMSGGLSLAKAQNLEWDLPAPQSVTMNGYDEQVQQDTFKFSVAPDREVDGDLNGIPVKEFFWDNPPQNSIITLTQTLQAQVNVDLSPFSSTAAYPLTNVPSDVQPYLDQSATAVSLPTSASTLLNQFKTGQTTEAAVVQAAVNWVASNLTYSEAGLDQQDDSNDAANVLNTKTANCRGYDNLVEGVLRALGIPARAQSGWVSAQPIEINDTADNASTTMQWSHPGTAGEAHTWLNVWFPDVGWVPFDPQQDKFFVDPRHVAFFTQSDATIPTLQNVAAESDDPNDPNAIFGQNIPGTTGVEVLPGFGASQVTLSSTDNFNVKVLGLKHDVSNVVLYTR